MKYAKVQVKCSGELLLEIDRFIVALENCSEELKDFLLEVKEGVSERLEVARNRNEMLEHTVYAEISMTLPKSIYEKAKNYICDKSTEYSELYMLFENIARIKEYLFKR